MEFLRQGNTSITILDNIGDYNVSYNADCDCVDGMVLIIRISLE